MSTKSGQRVARALVAAKLAHADDIGGVARNDHLRHPLVDRVVGCQHRAIRVAGRNITFEAACAQFRDELDVLRDRRVADFESRDHDASRVIV